MTSASESSSRPTEAWCRSAASCAEKSASTICRSRPRGLGNGPARTWSMDEDGGRTGRAVGEGRNPGESRIIENTLRGRCRCCDGSLQAIGGLGRAHGRHLPQRHQRPPPAGRSPRAHRPASGLAARRARPLAGVTNPLRAPAAVMGGLYVSNPRPRLERNPRRCLMAAWLRGRPRASSSTAWIRTTWARRYACREGRVATST